MKKSKCFIAIMVNANMAMKFGHKTAILTTNWVAVAVV